MAWCWCLVLLFWLSCSGVVFVFSRCWWLGGVSGCLCWCFLCKEYAMRDSNPQPPDSKSDTLSIAPTAPQNETLLDKQTQIQHKITEKHTTKPHTQTTNIKQTSTHTKHTKIYHYHHTQNKKTNTYTTIYRSRKIDQNRTRNTRGN